MKCHKDYVGYESRTPWLVSKPIANSSAVSPPMTLQTVTACDLLALPVTLVLTYYTQLVKQNTY